MMHIVIYFLPCNYSLNKKRSFYGTALIGKAIIGRTPLGGTASMIGSRSAHAVQPASMTFSDDLFVERDILGQF